jgi:hypothetical protein
MELDGLSQLQHGFGVCGAGELPNQHLIVLSNKRFFYEKSAATILFPILFIPFTMFICLLAF